MGRTGRVAAAVGVLALLGLVAAASRGAPATAAAALPEALGRTLADVLLYAGAAWVLLTLLFIVWALWPDRSYRVALPERPPAGRRLLSAAMAALALVILFYAKPIPLRRFANAAQGAGAGSPPNARIEAASAASGPGFDLPALLIVLGLLAVLGFVLFSVLRKRLKPLPELELHTQLVRALEESLEDLRAEPDLRRAVIAAYARMERVLDRHGLPRRPSEAPYEYVARAFERLQVGAGHAGRLTELFEWAKFSPHGVDAAMRDEAIAALERVRADLRPRAAEPAFAA